MTFSIRGLLLTLAALPLVLINPIAAHADGTCSARPAYVSLRGVNLAGAEFGKKVPGTYNGDYRYPDVSDFDYYKSKGLKLFRIPFRWERMQRSFYGPLDPAELSHLDEIVAAAASRGLNVVLDAHIYGRYNKENGAAPGIIGSPDVPTAALVDFWTKMAVHFKCNPAIYGYDLSNEPYDMNDLWPKDAQAAIDGIRTVDMGTPIIVEGNRWASAEKWIEQNPDFPLHDRANNLIYEAHCYFDSDSGGNYRVSYDDEHATPDIGVKRVTPFLNWLKQHHARGYVGEYGIPGTDPRWFVVLDNFLKALKANNVSGTYWAGGRFICGEGLTTISPCNGNDAPQMGIVERTP